MPLSEAQQEALGNFAGLRRVQEGVWKEATEEELLVTPSPLVEHRDALVARTQATADFLGRVDRTETVLVRTVTRRTARSTLSLLESLLNLPGSS